MIHAVYFIFVNLNICVLSLAVGVCLTTKCRKMWKMLRTKREKRMQRFMRGNVTVMVRGGVNIFMAFDSTGRVLHKRAS